MTASCPKSVSLRHRLLRTVSAITLSLVASIAVAVPVAAPVAAAAVQPTGSLIGEIAGVLLPVLFVIAGLVVVLVLARKRFGLTGKDTPLSIVQILPVGSRERIVLVRTRAGRVLAMGVASNAVTLLAELDEADVYIEPATPVTKR